MMLQSDLDHEKSFANPNAFDLELAKKKSDEEEMPTENIVKHPLQHAWSLWYLKYDPSRMWKDMQTEIISFDTVEDFWTIYYSFKRPSQIQAGSDYSLFKKGIRPMWEDPANRQGGRWVIVLDENSKEDLDNFWLDVLLCLIGEAFQHYREICGAVVNVRKNICKISIWTAHGNNEEATLGIGQKLKEELCLGDSNLNYFFHKDTMFKQGINAKSTYIL